MVTRAQESLNAGSLLWQRFKTAAKETGAGPLQQMAKNLWQKKPYQNTGSGTKQFLLSFSERLGGRRPEAVWAAFNQQSWDRRTLQGLAEALNKNAPFPALQDVARQNFSRAAAILTAVKSPAGLDEIRFVKDVLARAKAGTASKDAILKARDYAKYQGLHADYQALSRYAGSGASNVLPLVLGATVLVGLGLFLRKA